MSDIVIKAENVSKKYIISHKHSNGTYTTLRDVMMSGVKNGFNNSLSKAKVNSEIEEFWALKNINFEIQRGEVVGIIGRNGAGKSTLFKILLGVLSRITESTEGKLTIKGRVSSLLEVGTGFHPELTGRENIFLNGAILGMSRSEIKRKFDEIVEFSGVEKFLDTPVKRYSSGMYMRLAFSVAANLESEILVIDEVLAVGDAEFQKKCLGKMGEVSKQEGRTVLFVSHNMAAVKSLCTHSFLLEKGSIVQQGETNYILSLYQKRGLAEMRNDGDLSNCKRTGGDALRLEKCVFKNQVGEESSIIAVGEALCIELSFRTFDKKIQNLRFALCFFDTETNALVTELNTYYGYNQLIGCNEAGVYKIRFYWSELQLSPKEYNLGIMCTSGLEVMDWVKEARILEVAEGQFYSSGQMPLPGHYPSFFTKFKV